MSKPTKGDDGSLFGSFILRSSLGDKKRKRAREGGRDNERHREKLNSQGQQTI